MGLTPQAIVLFLGIAALLVAVVFAILAAQYYFKNDIRAIMRDLGGAGPASARAGSGGSSTRRRTRRRRESAASAPAAVSATAGASTNPVVGTTSEDGVETEVDSVLRDSGRAVVDFKRDKIDGNDDIETVVSSPYEYHQNAGSTGFEGDDLPTSVASEDEAEQRTFVLTRSVVVISSKEVITES